MLDGFRLGRKSVKEKGVATAVMAAVIVVIVVVAGVGAYFVLKEGGAPSGENSKVETMFTPSTIHVGDLWEYEARVTNNETGTMTVSKLTIMIYHDNQLKETDTAGAHFYPVEISPGRTVTIFGRESRLYVIPEFSYPNDIGNWRFDISLNTNYWTLTDSCSLTVLV